MSLEWSIAVIRATRELAGDVRDGRRKGSQKCPVPSALRPWGWDPHTVDDAVSSGAQLLAEWAKCQTGAGATAWPRKLETWLDDWEADFSRSDGGDEAKGFGRLIALLDDIELAIGLGMKLQ